jgi:DNA-directed RNA polymerase subunit RPC12/RpoP
MAEKCVVCESELNSINSKEVGDYIDCPSCGQFVLMGAAQAQVKSEIAKSSLAKAKLRHALHQITKREPWANIDANRLRDLLARTDLPKPAELLNNFILWLGNAQSSLGEDVEVGDDIFAAVGATDDDDVAFLIDHCKAAGLLRGSVERFGGGKFIIMPLKLTINGWLRFEELQRGTSTARTAFMAMQFGDAQLDAFYRDHLRTAVASTGFELRRVDEEQPAGLIDDHLRVKIRQSRFLIADLTHHNRGAYWEAGYAEGLGKPVIYTCRKDVFEDKAQTTHFDTNHHLTVVWDPANIPLSVQRLKDTIRATLPAESVLQDS